MKDISTKDLLMISLSDELNYQSGIAEYVKICPKGFVDSTKGKFLVDDESIRHIENWQNHRGIDIVIDYEHQTLNSEKAPAAGWIKSLKTESDGLYAQIEWTEAAKQHLMNKEYRYFSPVVMVRPSDQRAIQLHSVALTNTPAINKMTPIINSENHTTLLGALIFLLGLPKGTTEEEVISMINDIQNEMGPLTATSLKDNLISVIPDASTSKMIYLLKEQLKEQNKQYEMDMTNRLIKEMLDIGKLIPAHIETATQFALSDRNGFIEFMNAQPQIVPMGRDNPPRNSGGYQESKLSNQLGVTRADIEMYNK